MSAQGKGIMNPQLFQQDFNASLLQLPLPSNEQLAAVGSLLEERKNVMLHAVAGSGKTMTSLYVAAASDQKVLLLTYNARLKNETREKARVYGLTNLEVHSYHAMGFKYYTDTCFTDKGLREVVEEDKTSQRELPKYGVIVLDECQDMTHLLFAFSMKVLRDIKAAGNSSPLILVVGDEKQCVFEFRGADSRFLTLADKLFSVEVCGEWTKLGLSTSYRVTHNIATFVNEVMLGESDCIVASKPPGPPVKYLVGSPFIAAKWIAQQITKEIKNGKIKPHEIFVLAASVRTYSNRAPLKILENMLVEARIPLYVQTSDDEFIDEKSSQNKVIFSTFHQSKGLERRWVFVIGFESAYFQLYGRDRDPNFCPCTLYVAATRATELLCVVGEKDKGKHLPFLRLQQLYALSNEPSSVVDLWHTDFLCGANLLNKSAASFLQMMSNWHRAGSCASFGTPATPPAHDMPHARHFSGHDRRTTAGVDVGTDDFTMDTEENKDKTILACDITRFLPEHFMSNLKGRLHCTQIQPPSQKIHIPVTTDGTTGDTDNHATDQGELVENISDLNGLAIPAMLEAKIRTDHKCTMFDELIEASTSPTEKMPAKLQQRVRKFTSFGLLSTPSHFLELAALYQAGASINCRGFLSKLVQIKDFNWLSDEIAEKCLSTLKKAIPTWECASFEVLLEQRLFVGEKQVIVLGLVDIMTPTELWEIKCVGQLRDEHIMQLAVYAWLWKCCKPREKKQFKLFNVLSNEMWEISTAEVDFVMQSLLKYYFRSRQTEPDAAFLQTALAVAVKNAQLKHFENLDSKKDIHISINMQHPEYQHFTEDKAPSSKRKIDFQEG